MSRTPKRQESGELKHTLWSRFGTQVLIYYRNECLVACRISLQDCMVKHVIMYIEHVTNS